MKTVTLQPTRSAARSGHGSGHRPEMTAEAVDLLRDLGAEVVDRCQANCEICGPVLDAAA